MKNTIKLTNDIRELKRELENENVNIDNLFSRLNEKLVTYGYLNVDEIYKNEGIKLVSELDSYRSDSSYMSVNQIIELFGDIDFTKTWCYTDYTDCTRFHKLNKNVVQAVISSALNDLYYIFNLLSKD